MAKLSLAALVCAICAWTSCTASSPPSRRNQIVFEAPVENSAPSTPAQEGYRGWSSWSLQAYKGEGYGFYWLTEKAVKAQADVLARDYLPLGYDRVNLDSGWQGGVDDFGRHKIDLGRFPSGVPGLRKYLADRGLKMGLYYLPGIDGAAVTQRSPIMNTPYTADAIVQCPPFLSTPTSCRRPPANAFQAGLALNYSHPGAQAYIDSVVAGLYEWNVSFVKLDGNVPGSSVDPASTYSASDEQGHKWNECDTRPDLKAWRSAIDRLHAAWAPLGRDKIWLTASWELPPALGPDLRRTVDSWRVAIDIEAYGQEMTTFDRVIRNAKKGALWSSIESNRGTGLVDMDAVLVSNMSYAEAQSMVTLWAITGTPFYAGDDLTVLAPSRRRLLRNPKVLDVQRRSGSNPARLLHYSAAAASQARPGGDPYPLVLDLDQKSRLVRAAYGLGPLPPQDAGWAAARGDPPRGPPAGVDVGGHRKDNGSEWKEQVWYAQHSNGDVIVALVNAGEQKWWDAPRIITFSMSMLPLANPAEMYLIRDAWRQERIGYITRDVTIAIPFKIHESRLWVLEPVR